MPPDEYVKALDKALADLEDRVQKRDLYNAEIAGLRETVRVLADRVPIAFDRQQRIAQLLAMVDYATPTLRDSIRGLLTQILPNHATAVEVRNALEDKGFNFEDFSNPLSACHATIKRMLIDKEVEPGPEINGKPTYKRVLPVMPASRRALHSLYAGYAGEEKGGPLSSLAGATMPLSSLLPDVPNPFGKNLAEMLTPPPGPTEKQRIIPRRRGIGSRIAGLEEGGKK